MGKLNEFRKSVVDVAKRNSSELLLAVEIASGVSAIIFTAIGTVKAVKKVEQKKEELGRDLTKKEIAKEVWPCYIPVVVSEVAQVTSAVERKKVNAKNTAVLATAYTLTDQAFREYKEKVVETIGEKKQHEIMSEIAKDKIRENPPHNNEVIITGKGKTLCYDPASGRYFECDIETIRKAEAKLNQEITRSMYASLNDYYDLVGLPATSLGDDLGWNGDSLVEFSYSSTLTEDDRPCLVVDFYVQPRADYRRLM